MTFSRLSLWCQATQQFYVAFCRNLSISLFGGQLVWKPFLCNCATLIMSCQSVELFISRRFSGRMSNAASMACGQHHLGAFFVVDRDVLFLRFWNGIQVFRLWRSANCFCYASNETVLCCILQTFQQQALWQLKLQLFHMHLRLLLAASISLVKHLNT